MVLLEELYREHRQRLYTVAYAILHQPEEAEDAVHDTFVRLAENRHRLHIRSGEEGRALLTAIARNAAIDRLRHRERANLPLPTFCPDVEDRPSAVAEADALLAAVRALPPLYRDVLLLVCMDTHRVRLPRCWGSPRQRCVSAFHGPVSNSKKGALPNETFRRPQKRFAAGRRARSICTAARVFYGA